MGTLGQYLRGARETRGIDLRDAAQQTRISLMYLKALEAEDFSKLPGEVFVKGFLKNYGKFLRLDESEVMKRYAELKPSKSAQAAAADRGTAAADNTPNPSHQAMIEPLLWGTGIVIALILFVFAALPGRHAGESKKTEAPVATGQTATVPVPAALPEKLYLEVIALENTWLLVRTDNSPQKKAVLKKGESLIWSADERFLLSYGSARSVRLMLNGQELIVSEPRDAVVRDLAIAASGIVGRKSPSEYARPARLKKKPVPEQQAPPTDAPLQGQQTAPDSVPLPGQPIPLIPMVPDGKPLADAPREQQAAPTAVPPAPAAQGQPEETKPQQP